MKKGLYGLEIFQLNYGGKNIFLEVSDIVSSKYHIVKTRELDTYEFEGNDMIRLSNDGKSFRAKDKTQLLDDHEHQYIITREGDFYMSVHVSENSKLYNEISKIKDVSYGEFIAKMIGDGTNDSFHKLAHTSFERDFISQSDRHWA